MLFPVLKNTLTLILIFLEGALTGAIWTVYLS